MVTKICQFCGNEYQTYNKNSKYCSRECKNKSQSGRNKIICVCAHCGKKVGKWPWQIKNSPSVQFCSRQCAAQYKKKRITVQCDFCGKYIEKNTCHVKRAERHFCGPECSGHWMSENLIGENHPTYNQIEAICEQCGKAFKRKPSQIEKHNQSFCSKECHFQYQRTHPISPEQSELLRQTAFKTMKTYPRETTIEKAIRGWLETNDIAHIPQCIIKDKFCVDFFLPEYNVVIEALGDYWHGNDRVYGDNKTPLNDMQKKNMKMDKARFAYLRKCGYSVYGFWECDIHKNLDKLMNSITELKAM